MRLQPQEAADERDTAITAEMGQCLEPLWVALSAAISQIAAGLPAHVDTGSEQPSAAASILPPGAAQVHFDFISENSAAYARLWRHVLPVEQEFLLSCVAHALKLCCKH